MSVVLIYLSLLFLPFRFSVDTKKDARSRWNWNESSRNVAGWLAVDQCTFRFGVRARDDESGFPNMSSTDGRQIKKRSKKLRVLFLATDRTTEWQQPPIDPISLSQQINRIYVLSIFTNDSNAFQTAYTPIGLSIHRGRVIVKASVNIGSRIFATLNAV